MNEFYTQLLKHEEKFTELQKKEMELKMEMHMANEAFGGFLKEHGLPEHFTMAQAMMLAVRKSRD